jgi:hypothetical protein
VLGCDHAQIPVDDLARTLRVSGIFLEAFGDTEGALSRARMAAEIYERAGNLGDAAFARSVAGVVMSGVAGPEAAFDTLFQAIEQARSAGDPIILPAGLNNYAVAALGAGDLDRARPIMVEASALIGEKTGPMAAVVATTYADVVRLDGDLPAARTLYTRSLRDGWPGRLAGIVMSNLMGLAMTAAAAEQWGSAARMMGVVAAFLRVGDNDLEPDTGNFQDEYQDDVARARAALGEEAFRTAWADGVATPLEAIVAELLAEEHVPGG